MSSALLNLLDRPIAFHRCFAELAGSIEGGIFLSQVVYWRSRGTDDGWFYKSSVEWTDETMLSEEQQRRIRKRLVEAGFIKERYERAEHKLYFQLQESAISEALKKIALEHPTKRRVAPCKTSGGTLQNTGSYKNRDYTETTQDRGRASAPPSPDLFGTAKKPKAESEKISFVEYEKRCIESKQPVIPSDHAVFGYIETIELPDRYCQLAYFVFERTYRDKPGKRYIDWPKHFHNAVRGNWFRLWRVARDGDERWALTTEGVQAELEAIAAGQLARAA
jgi:hypothetical protein